jgi:hypothetical protein
MRMRERNQRGKYSEHDRPGLCQQRVPLEVNGILIS